MHASADESNGFSKVRTQEKRTNKSLHPSAVVKTPALKAEIVDPSRASECSSIGSSGWRRSSTWPELETSNEKVGPRSATNELRICATHELRICATHVLLMYPSVSYPTFAG